MSGGGDVQPSGASAPCVVRMHGKGDGDNTSAEPLPAKSKSKKSQRHSFSTSGGLSDLWQKSLRGFGIQRWRAHDSTPTQPPAEGGPTGVATVLELKSIESVHEPEDPTTQPKKRWSFQSFTKSKGATEALTAPRRSMHVGHSIQGRTGSGAGDVRACDALVGDIVLPETSQRAAHRAQSKARSFQHTEAVPVAYSHSIQDIDEASATQNPYPLTPWKDLSAQHRSVAMHAEHAVHSQRVLHTQIERSQTDTHPEMRGSVDHMLSIGRHGPQRTAPTRASRVSLDVGKFFRGMGRPSMQASRSKHAENACTVPAVEVKSAFGRGSFEVGPAGKYRRMHASWRTCVFPLIESDTETSSAQS